MAAPRLLRLCWLLALLAASPWETGLRADPPPASQAALQPSPAGVPAADYETGVKPFIAKYCLECHSGEKAKGGLAFDKIESEADVRKYRQLAERVRKVLDEQTMPPKDPQPEDRERAAVLGWLDTKILKVDCNVGIDPGRVTLRRLNRAEYNNTIRDLLALDFRPADDFPSDDVGYGFDNIGDVLSLPPVLFEKYLAAAEKISELAIVAPDADREPLAQGKGGNLFSVSETSLEFETKVVGDYRLRAKAWAQQAGNERAKMSLKLDGKDLTVAEVVAEGGQSADHDWKLRLEPGKHTFTVGFLNDFYDPKNPDRNQRDRNLIVDKLQVLGPLDVLPENLPESHRRVVTHRPATPAEIDGALRQCLGPLARRVYRRPVTDEEVQRLTALARSAIDAGESYERGLQLGLQALLVSPEFLFRLEAEPGDGQPRVLSEHELASRLSYFLWSSTPDEELLGLADRGELRRDGQLAAQVRRLLADPRSVSLVDNFASQWLNLRLLKGISPDRKRFPGFDDQLKADMETETRLFIQAVIRENRPLADLLDARETFVNERLAKHYGIEGVTGEEFRRVVLGTPQRGGLLGQASILTVTSNPTRTSPVKRGKWVLENLFNAPPPPPPPGVPELEKGGEALTGTLRQRMEQHRANPACAVCHTQMDALGFGLENYDAVGAWRDRDGEFDIDASGVLPAGETFQSPEGLRLVLKNRLPDFRRCLTEKLLTYALGRGLEYYDECTVNVLVNNVAGNGDTFQALVLAIVESEPFQKRRAKRENEP